MPAVRRELLHVFSQILIGTWRQPTFAGAAIVFAQMRKVALTRMTGDWAADWPLAG